MVGDQELIVQASGAFVQRSTEQYSEVPIAEAIAIGKVDEILFPRQTFPSAFILDRFD